MPQSSFSFPPFSIFYVSLGVCLMVIAYLDAFHPYKTSPAPLRVWDAITFCFPLVAIFTKQWAAAKNSVISVFHDFDMLTPAIDYCSNSYVHASYICLMYVIFDDRVVDVIYRQSLLG